MSSAAYTIATHPELVATIVKAEAGVGGLTREERVQYNFFQLMVLRRLESLYMQRVLGALDSVMSTGFERSVISTLTSGGGAEWWQIAKNAFTPEFAAHIDAELASGVHAPLHPGFGRK